MTLVEAPAPVQQPEINLAQVEAISAIGTDREGVIRDLAGISEQLQDDPHAADELAGFLAKTPGEFNDLAKLIDGDDAVQAIDLLPAERESKVLDFIATAKREVAKLDKNARTREQRAEKREAAKEQARIAEEKRIARNERATHRRQQKKIGETVRANVAKSQADRETIRKTRETVARQSEAKRWNDRKKAVNDLHSAVQDEVAAAEYGHKINHGSFRLDSDPELRHSLREQDVEKAREKLADEGKDVSLLGTAVDMDAEKAVRDERRSTADSKTASYAEQLREARSALLSGETKISEQKERVNTFETTKEDYKIALDSGDTDKANELWHELHNQVFGNPDIEQGDKWFDEIEDIGAKHSQKQQEQAQDDSGDNDVDFPSWVNSEEDDSDFPEVGSGHIDEKYDDDEVEPIHWSDSVPVRREGPAVFGGAAAAGAARIPRGVLESEDSLLPESSPSKKSRISGILTRAKDRLASLADGRAINGLRNAYSKENQNRRRNILGSVAGAVAVGAGIFALSRYGIPFTGGGGSKEHALNTMPKGGTGKTAHETATTIRPKSPDTTVTTAHAPRGGETPKQMFDRNMKIPANRTAFNNMMSWEETYIRENGLTNDPKKYEKAAKAFVKGVQYVEKVKSNELVSTV